MGPIDYNIDVQTPFQATLQGYQAGAAIRDDQMKQQQQQLALQQQQQQQQVIKSLIANPNPTAQDYAAATLAVPGLREHFKQAWDMHNSDQQQNSLAEIGQVHAALTNGQPQIAIDILNKRANALENSNGPKDQIDAARNMAKVIEANPTFAKSLTGMKLMSIPGGDKVISSMSTMGQEQRAAEQAPYALEQKKAEAKEAGVKADVAEATKPAQIKKPALENENIESTIKERAARLGLDQDRLTSETQLKMYEMRQKAGTLDDGAKKIINDSTINSVSADQSAGQMLSLADQLEKTDPSSGLYAKGKELYKNVTGNQNAITGLRNEYVRLRNTQALKMLPPGPASDKDIQMAMKGFPEDTADAAVMASFLRGMAKMQQRESVLESAKAEWVNAVGHLGKPKTDIEIDGVKVPAGMTFTDFGKQFLQRKTEQRATDQNVKMIQGRSYMRFANASQPALGTGFAPNPGVQ
jgi:hypothetical protein